MSGLSITALTAEQDQEDEGFDLALTDAKGEPVGVTVRIVGRYSARYRKAQAAALRKRFQLGRTPEFDPEQGDADALQITARCVLGWSGIEEPYTPENVMRLLANRRIREQIETAAEKPAGFFKASSVS